MSNETQCKVKRRKRAKPKRVVAIVHQKEWDAMSAETCQALIAVFKRLAELETIEQDYFKTLAEESDAK